MRGPIFIVQPVAVLVPPRSHGLRRGYHADHFGAGHLQPVLVSFIKSSAGANARAARRSLRLVVCDDMKDSRELLAEALRGHGHQVAIAADGAAALAKIRGGRIDAAVLDIGLPDMTGYEVAREVRRCPALRGIRLIAVTGFAGAAYRAAALESGFDAHLVKPVSVATLLDALYNGE